MPLPGDVPRGGAQRLDEVGDRLHVGRFGEVVAEAGFACAPAVPRLVPSSHGRQYRRRAIAVGQQPTGHFVAVHARHPDVEQHQLWMERAGLDQCLPAIVGDAGAQPERLDQQPQRGGGVQVVVHHQHPQVAARVLGGAGAPGRRHGLHRLVACQWQGDGEPGTGARTVAVGVHGAAVQFHQAADQRQADPESLAMIRRLLESLDLPHLKFVGVADDRPKVEAMGDLPMIGGYHELAELARRGEIDQVLISVPNLPPERLHDIVDGLSGVSVDVSLIPFEAIELAPDYKVHLLGSLPVLNLWQRPFRDINQFVKRGEDLVVATLIIVLLSPVMAIAALLIRLTSPGPVIFVQPRVGFDNEVINVFKFRTMYADQTDLGARATTTRDDPRVTPVGRVLRKLSIDELPQLFNVIRGDMSLVGPRPHALEMRVGDHYYQDAVRGYAGRHRVRPGITGLAQVRGLRGEIRTVDRAKRRVELDKQYIDNWSLLLDIRILMATFRAVLFDRDAY